MEARLVLFAVFAVVALGLVIADNDVRSRIYLSHSRRGRVSLVLLALAVDWAGLFMAYPITDLFRGGLVALGGAVSVFALLTLLPVRLREGITSRDNVGWILILAGSAAFWLIVWATMSLEGGLVVVLSLAAILAGYAMVTHRKPKEEAA